MKTEEKLVNTIKAGATIIQIVSYETQRIHGIVNDAAHILRRKWYTWNRVDGIKEWLRKEKKFGEAIDETAQPQFALEWFMKETDEVSDLILILEDFHPDLTDDKVSTIRRLRNIALQSPNNKTLILAQPFLFLPKELEKEVQVIELPLPSLEDLKIVCENVCDQYELQENAMAITSKLLESALGLTIMEARIAFSKAVVEAKKLTEAEIPRIIVEKENIIKKSRFLEYYHPTENLDDIGGLDTLKDWLKRRGKAFGKGAKEYGLDTPKGVLLLGIPGTGKSLSAKAIASAWQFPLLRLDMGKVFGGLVGESENNIRQALLLAEAISPSILWIDEIEKGMSGMSSSGATDGGTTARVLGTFLTWMQEKAKPVFVVATANNISMLPPELLRKGRVDEIFFVDLPGRNAREEILKIHLRRKKRNSKEFDLKKLAEISRGFSGAELEEAIKESLFRAFDRGESLTTNDIEEAISQTYPLSKTMGDTIKNLRSWAKSRAVYASPEETEDLSEPKEKRIPKLKQEYSNPFISGEEK